MAASEIYQESLLTDTPQEGRYLATKLLKIIVGLLLFLATSGQAFACEVCENKQPKGLENVTHGAGPQNDGDFLIIGLAIIIVLITLFFSLKFLIRPGEFSDEHIKNSVLEKH